MFGKLAFWKKDPFDFEAPPGAAQPALDVGGELPASDPLAPSNSFSPLPLPSNAGMQMQSMPQNTFERVGSASAPQAFSQYQGNVQQNETVTLSKNIEIISSKMDTIRAMLENLSQRLARIEEMAAEETKPKQRYNQW